MILSVVVASKMVACSGWEKRQKVVNTAVAAATKGHDEAAGDSRVHREDASKEKLGLLTVHHEDKLGLSWRFAIERERPQFGVSVRSIHKLLPQN